MNDFWGLADGSSAVATGDTYETPGAGNFTPLPEGSQVLAVIDEGKWDEQTDTPFVSLRWSVVAPEAYARRKVFQKLYVDQVDPKVADPAKALTKRDNAKRMLMSIDKNADGNLAKIRTRPTSEDLAVCLQNQPMVIRLGFWELEDRQEPGKFISGNWVQAILPATTRTSVPELAPAAPRAAQAPRAPTATTRHGAVRGPIIDDADEIPF